MRRIDWILFILLLVSLACQRIENKQIKQWKASWQKYVAEKDSLFKHADWSPLTEEDRADFKGLKYFDYNPAWRFELALHPYPNPQKMMIKGTKPGDERPALRFAYFQFAFQGVPVKLDVIKILPQSPQGQAHLFLGFWDETSGKETYAGGRYIDLEKNENGLYIVDFNYAYNPYCAYNERYSCAVPPFSNQIPVAVRAGEKNFKEHH